MENGFYFKGDEMIVFGFENTVNLNRKIILFVRQGFSVITKVNDKSP